MSRKTLTMLSTAQAAAKVGLSESRIRRLIRDEILRATRIGLRSWAIDPADLARLTVHGKAGRPKQS